MEDKAEQASQVGQGWRGNWSCGWAAGGRRRGAGSLEVSWDGAQTASVIPSLSFSSLPSRISPGFLEAA